MAFVFGPKWFYGLDAGFELIAAVATLLIAFYALRVYKLTKLRKYLYFMLAFVLISGSYILRAVADYTVYSSLIGQIPNITSALQAVAPIQNFYSTGVILFMVLSFAGFMMLVALYMGIQSFRTVTLLFLLAILIALLSVNKFIAFHATLIVMLLFIVAHLSSKFGKRKRASSFLVLYGMSSLLAAQLFFLMLGLGAIYYVVGHVLQLFGFILLLLNMMIVFNK